MRRFGRDERGEEKKIHKQYCPVKIYRSFRGDEEKEGAFSRMRKRGGGTLTIYTVSVRERSRSIVIYINVNQLLL